jgi:hypothetical protein
VTCIVQNERSHVDGCSIGLRFIEVSDLLRDLIERTESSILSYE